MLDIIAKITMVDILSSIAIVSAIMVIWVGNPIHSVLFLVLVFINMAGILIIYGAEFLGLLFIIVYIGAIAILFLFVVMMLPTRVSKPKISILFVILALLLALFVGVQFIGIELVGITTDTVAGGNPFSVRTITPMNNVEVLASLLYDEFNAIFLISGLILLVAIFGAIVLTTQSSKTATHHLSEPKRQEVYLQLARDFKTTVVLKDLQ